MLLPNDSDDTIVAVATPRGRGGIGIVRVSGGKAPSIAKHILGKLPKPRLAEYLPFLNEQQEAIDQGIALYFKAPNSFTGEDVLELQGHGGPVVMDSLLKTSIAFGARLAEPGEFTLRAFLNNKIDLLQAEAVSDLINANTLDAAKGAMRSLQGDFSKLVEAVIEDLIKLRMYVEAAIDFPEEEIDFLSDGGISEQLQKLLEKLNKVKDQAQQGALITDGIKVVIAGRPNAGKSSLLNALAGLDAAIVTDIPGTTRDVLREQISIDGLQVEFIDTAGLRESGDQVEAEGIRRALKEISMADHMVWVVDASEQQGKEQQHDDLWAFTSDWQDLNKNEINKPNRTIFYNKVDKVGKSPEIKTEKDKNNNQNYTVVYASAKTGEGLDLFKEHIKKAVGFADTNEGNFTARRRHLESMQNAQICLKEARRQLVDFKAGELLAEELRQAQLALESITGRFTSDDLLGKIFSEFCIGK